ncbi:6-carboxytetrahydropterin synthase [Virgibacillus ihumii]|uniref:6-carboxytetrahydropterin synthase n=1 Tax=Virgibacillus ihumii TaxID=2686091 RepID=UPI00157CA6E1|nr:6-carboxytetrahydropterin synthase [Virgibacillus ihumii]
MMQQIYPVPDHDYAYELNKEFHFSAAHYIADESAGKCQYTHGHTYFVNITIAGGQLNQIGFLADFKTIKDLIHKRFDHTTLNEDPVFSNQQVYFPTTEVVAEKVYEIIQGYLNNLDNQPVCLQVFLRETPTSYCIYRPKGETDQ